MKHFHSEMVLYFLAAWNHSWIQHEQIRAQFQMAPWLMFKTPEEREDLGYGSGRILTQADSVPRLVGLSGGKLDS